MQSLFSLYPHLTTCPLALISWQDFRGEINWKIIDWVGIIGGKVPRLRFGATGCPQSLNLLREDAEFSVNVPSDEILSTLKAAGQFSSSDKGKICLSLSFERGAAIRGPRLADCPVVFECRASEIRSQFERTIVTGEVAAVHVGGRIYKADRRFDICGLRPLARRWFEKEKLPGSQLP